MEMDLWPLILSLELNTTRLVCKASEEVVLGIDEQHSKEAKFSTQSACGGEREGHAGEGRLEFLLHSGGSP